MIIRYADMLSVRLSMVVLLVGLFCCKGTQTTAYPDSSHGYTNPVLARDFPDPTVIRGHDGLFYCYATNASGKDGKLLHIQVARSSDLVNWEIVGDAIPDRPNWADKDFWAPHVIYDKSTRLYYLYYSGESNEDSVGKCLGVATSSSPAGPFIDKGTPLICGETFVNIDPMAFDDPVSGKKLLYWGSAFKPIRVQELEDDRLSFKAGSVPVDVVSPIQNNTPDNYERLIEGAWVHFREGRYYMFYSGDNCCGDRAHYAVMVARSERATGPFIKMSEAISSANSVILQRNARWIAPGHNSIVTDASSEDWIVYHAIDSANRNGGRVMLIDRLIYKAGWPQIQSGTPSTNLQQRPRVK